MEKSINWRDVWTTPFKVVDPYIKDDKSRMVMCSSGFSSRGRGVLRIVCAILNGEDRNLVSVERNGSVEIIVNGCHLIVRGWGYLTGVGGLNMSTEEAEKVQDEFSDWIFETLQKQVNQRL